MKIAAVFLLQKARKYELLAFFYSKCQLKENFDLFCIVVDPLKSYVLHDLDFNEKQIIVDPNALKSLDHYTRFMKQSDLYERFIKYDYLLVWQDDALVLNAKALQGREMKYSFIGSTITKQVSGVDYKYVGNGGLSLRKIDDHLNALSKISLKEPKSFTRQSLRNYIAFKLEKIALMLGHSLLNYNEDFFWCCLLKDNNYSVASISEADDLFWEDRLSKFMLQDLVDLPFGLHAWEKFSSPENSSFINLLLESNQIK